MILAQETTASGHWRSMVYTGSMRFGNTLRENLMRKEAFANFPMLALFLPIFLISVAGCAWRESGQAASTNSADRESIENVVREIEHVYRTGSPSYVDLYDEDPVVTLPGREVMTTRKEIIEFWDGFVATYDAHQQLTTEEIIVAGDWAIVRNIFDLTLSPKSGAEPFRRTGRNLLVLRRQENDSWKLARVIAYVDG